MREQADYEVDWAFFYKYRRLVKRWCVSNANGVQDGEKRRKAISSARRMLRCSRPDVSPYRGVSAWIPETVAKQLMASISIEGGER